jgi:hypothetical protein
MDSSSAFTEDERGNILVAVVVEYEKALGRISGKPTSSSASSSSSSSSSSGGLIYLRCFGHN